MCVEDLKIIAREHKKWLFLGVAAVLAVVLIVALWPRTKEQPSPLDPRHDPDDMNYVPSYDHNALVGFQGYLMYAEHSDQPVLLKLKSVSIETQEDRPYPTLVLDLEHSVATFYFQPQQAPTGSGLVENHEVAIVNLDKVDMSCSVLKPTPIKFNVGHHFECKRPFAMQCVSPDSLDGTKKGKVIATLVIDAIRLELDGDPKDHEDRKFTHPAEYCNIK